VSSKRPGCAPGAEAHRRCGDIQQMPGLGKTPAALNVDIDEDGKTIGLF
jgi:formyltetrahydrofolate synthetase